MVNKSERFDNKYWTVRNMIAFLNHCNNAIFYQNVNKSKLSDACESLLSRPPSRRGAVEQSETGGLRGFKF